MDDNLYTWDPWIDHSWIAEDKSGTLAYVACCLGDALPRKVSIDKRLMAGLDLRLKTWFNVNEDIKRNPFALFASIGFFVYDATRTEDGKLEYELVGRPDKPISADSLPPSLKVVTRHFAIRSVEFSKSEQLPACDLFGSGVDVSECRALCYRAVGAIHECGAPRVSVSEHPNPGFGASERLKRGWLDLHAVMGFADMKKTIATLFKWEAYEAYFKTLLRQFTCMKGIGDVCVLGGDGCWRGCEECLANVDCLRLPPAKVRLKDCSGRDVAELELDSDCQSSCAACADCCRYLIHGSRKEYVAITNAIASSAHQVGIASRTPSSNWLLRIFT